MIYHPNLKVWYPLQNTTDQSGNGVTLTNTNSVTFTPSASGLGANFGTANTNKRLGNTSKSLDNALDFTLCARVKVLTEIATNITWTFFVNLNANPFSSTMSIKYWNSSGLRQVMWEYYFESNKSTSKQIAVVKTLGTTDYYNLALVCNGSNLQPTIYGYIDGVLMAQAQTLASRSGATSGSSYSAQNSIGAAQSGSQFASAIIDDVQAYQYMLPASDLKRIATGKHPLTRG